MQYVHLVQWADPSTRESGVAAVFADDEEAQAKEYAAKRERENPAGPDYYVERWKLGPR